MRNALTYLVDRHSEKSIIVLFNEPRIELRLYRFALLWNLPKIFELLLSKDEMLDYIIWKINNLIYQLEDDKRETVISWRIQGQEHYLNSVCWKISCLLERLLIYSS